MSCIEITEDGDIQITCPVEGQKIGRLISKYHCLLGEPIKIETLTMEKSSGWLYYRPLGFFYIGFGEHAQATALLTLIVKMKDWIKPWMDSDKYRPNESHSFCEYLMDQWLKQKDSLGEEFMDEPGIAWRSNVSSTAWYTSTSKLTEEEKHILTQRGCRLIEF